MESTPAPAPLVSTAAPRRRSFRKLTPAQLATVHWALTRSDPAPASAAAVAETFALDVSSVHRIRRTYRPPPPRLPAPPPVSFVNWRALVPASRRIVG